MTPKRRPTPVSAWSSSRVASARTPGGQGRRVAENGPADDRPDCEDRREVEARKIGQGALAEDPQERDDAEAEDDAGRNDPARVDAVESEFQPVPLHVHLRNG